MGGTDGDQLQKKTRRGVTYGIMRSQTQNRSKDPGFPSGAQWCGPGPWEGDEGEEEGSLVR